MDLYTQKTVLLTKCYVANNRFLAASLSIKQSGQIKRDIESIHYRDLWGNYFDIFAPRYF